MEITLRREELATELALLQGIVERRTTIPILSHVLLKVRGDRLLLAATDLDVSLATWCPGEAAREGGIAIQAKKFHEIVRALEQSELHLVEEEPQSLTIRSGQSRFRIRGLDPESFPTLPEVESENRVDVPLPLMKRLISKVIFAISAEDSRFQLNGALFKVKEGTLEMVATDGHRLALVEAELEGTEPQQEVLVPRKALQEILRFEGEGVMAYGRGDHHLSFRMERRELTCRILEGTFPDYEKVISRSQDKKAVVERSSLHQAVQRVALLTGERGRAIRLQFDADELTISAANPDLGDALERVRCEFEGEEMQLGLNPDYVAQFLAAADCERVRLEIKDSDSQCIGYPEDEGVETRYLCVIMPLRV